MTAAGTPRSDWSDHDHERERDKDRDRDRDQAPPKK